MPNSAIAPNPPQFPQTPQEYVKYLLKIRGVTVQKMCDDLYPALSKSTVDKWLSFQTTETSFSNVKTMVKYLGGSLDYLAQIESEAEPLPPPPEDKKPRADNPSLDRLVDSYEKEISRITEHHQREITRVMELVETGRQALISQHSAAIAHAKELCNTAIAETQKHLESFKAGRNVWRGTALALAGIILGIAVWLVWEFSNLSSGLTGYLLRQAGLLSLAGEIM